MSTVFYPSLYQQYVRGLKVQLLDITVAFVKQGWDVRIRLIPVIMGKLFQAVDIRGDNFAAIKKGEVVK